MKREALWKIYDSNYASDYNERYLSNPFSRVSSDTELKVLQTLVTAGKSWLDLGCGTGYFLSQFPGHRRAGLDYSPEMVRLATAANPDALFIQQGDFRDSRPEWSAGWDLITCMWGAYCYVESVQEVELFLENIIRWTASGGTVFIPIVDVEDVRPNLTMHYDEQIGVFGGKIAVTSINWTWEEENGKKHEHLVSPHIEHFIRLLSARFEKIEVIRYPPYKKGWVSRKAVLATGRKEEAAAQVRWQPVPEPAVASAPDELKAMFRAAMSPLSSRQMLAELFFRARSGQLFHGVARSLKRKTTSGNAAASE